MNSPANLELFTNFAIALLIGAMAGIDRERRKAQKGGMGIGGIRTFILLGLLGGTSSWLAQLAQSPWLFVGGFLAVAAAVIAGYILHARQVPESIGLTTEFAALSVFLLGGLALWKQPGLAVALGIVISATLAYKEPIHGFVGRLATDDIFAGIKLLIATFIVLPVLPDRAIDPWGALNPYKLWLLVVLISGLSLVGYVATRLLGTERGLAITGLSGGLASSTAVTLSFARRSREEAQNAAVGSALALGILLAWGVMFVRVVVMVAVVAPAVLPLLLAPFSVMGVATAVLCTVLYFSGRRQKMANHPSSQTQVPLKNPFSLVSAGKFALLFAAVLLLVKLVQHYFPGNGVYLVAAIAGMTDVDAISLSMANFATTGGNPVTVVTAITIAAFSNTIVKAGLAASLGSASLRSAIVAAAAIIMAAGAIPLLALK